MFLAQSSGWGVQRVVCDDGDPPSEGPGGKICAEIERALAAEVRSMSWPLTSWVTPVTEPSEAQAGLTKVRRKERLTFKGGQRERKGKTKQNRQTNSHRIWSWYQEGKASECYRFRSGWGPMREGKPQQKPWDRKSRETELSGL